MVEHQLVFTIILLMVYMLDDMYYDPFIVASIPIFNEIPTM